MHTPIIDLFAGPGGLGEGFASYETEDGLRPFDIRLSIEKDPIAHRTLELRSFFRQFRRSEVPEEYYQYCRGELSKNELFSKYPAESKQAAEEAWNAELGKITPAIQHRRLTKAIAGRRDWVLIGGPPCQAYSTVGRSRMRGADPTAFEADDRHFLYTEYLTILRKYAPAVFVMENVKGLLSSQVRGRRIFEKIVKDLRRKVVRGAPGYEVYSLVAEGNSTKLIPSDYVVEFEHYGVPQARHRVILVGVRRDITTPFPSIELHGPAPTVHDAIGDLPPVRSSLSSGLDSLIAWKKALESFKDVDWDYYSLDSELMERMQRAVANASSSGLGNDRYLSTASASRPAYSRWLQSHSKWFLDSRLGSGVLHHRARAHMREDLIRYLFVSSYGEVKRTSPRIRDFPVSILPDHANIHKAMGSDFFADRFRVQLWHEPSTTVMAHMAKDGHYFIHPSPEQCRSLTVREAARLQTFPDNYFFEGPRTEQYRQVGNAVPPMFARSVAQLVHSVIQKFHG